MSFQERYYVHEPGWLARVHRNVRLAVYLCRLAWHWFVLGGRVRRAYHRCEARGERYWIDWLADRNR